MHGRVPDTQRFPAAGHGGARQHSHPSAVAAGCSKPESGHERLQAAPEQTRVGSLSGGGPRRA